AAGVGNRVVARRDPDTAQPSEERVLVGQPAEIVLVIPEHHVDQRARDEHQHGAEEDGHPQRRDRNHGVASGGSMHYATLGGASSGRKENASSCLHEVRKESGYPFGTISRATRTTSSRVNPKCSNSSSAGADAPKRSMPIERPDQPVHRSQPNVLPASMDTRAVTAGGSTSSR